MSPSVNLRRFSHISLAISPLSAQLVQNTPLLHSPPLLSFSSSLPPSPPPPPLSPALLSSFHPPFYPPHFYSSPPPTFLYPLSAILSPFCRSPLPSPPHLSFSSPSFFTYSSPVSPLFSFHSPRVGRPFFLVFTLSRLPNSSTSLPIPPLFFPYFPPTLAAPPVFLLIRLSSPAPWPPTFPLMSLLSFFKNCLRICQPSRLNQLPKGSYVRFWSHVGLRPRSSSPLSQSPRAPFLFSVSPPPVLLPGSPPSIVLQVSRSRVWLYTMSSRDDGYSKKLRVSNANT